jgi:hypothetical protein
VTLTYDGVTERSFEHSRFLIARRDAKDADVLVLRLSDGQTALPVFGREEEAVMFLWLETAGEGWGVVEISEGGLVTLLCGSCAGVGRIGHPFVAKGVGKRLATVNREDFLRVLCGERSRRGAGAGPAWAAAMTSGSRP